MSRIELAENDQSGVVTSLPQETAVAIVATGLVDVRPVSADRWRLVPAANTIGAVRVGDADVVVHPKARFASLLFMLGYARDPGFRPEEFDGVAEDDLWPLVGETLARLANLALLRGVLQGYVTEDEALSVVRGRIRVADQMARHPGLLLPLEVRYDEYAVDIAENRILRSALHRIALVPRLPDGLRRRLAHLSARLDGVRMLTSGAPLPAWRPSRLNIRYQPALRLAELVLRTTGLGTSDAGQPVASFVVNMATVFEDFLTVALRETFARISTGRTDRQFRTYLDESGVVTIRPDVVHVIGGRPRAVIDAKYKLATGSGGYPVPDLYQMHAYCTVLRLERGYLAYAGSPAETAQSSAHRVRHTGITIVTWPLDVSAAPAQLLRQVDQLAATSLRAAPTPARRSPSG